MAELVLNLIKGDKIGSETDYRDSLPVNMVAIAKPVLGAAGYMLQSPGLTQYGTGSGIDRGALWNERFLNHYRVSGGKFISVAADGAVVELGDISGSDTASLPYSFNTQAIIADGRMWLYDTTAGFREVTDPDLGDPIDGVWVDGFYFMTDGEFIFHTDITDESSIDPLKFATAEFMPDVSNGVGKTQDNKVIVFGRYTCEYFVNDASSQFSFARVSSRAVKIGIVGTHAKAEMGDKWYLLGGRKEEAVSVHVLGVGAAQKVATREVDKIIGLYTETELESAVIESRSEDGYSFLVVHLPNHVLQFNETISSKVGIDQAWTILKTDVTGDRPWRAKHGLFEPRKGVWVYGDKRDSKIGILDETVSTHYGDISEWILDTPFTFLESMSINELELETLPGHTTTLDATVFVSITYDGVTLGTEFIELYGLPSQYGKRFIIRRLGDVPDWFGFRFRGASRSRMAFAKADIDYG
jgi:hypothetical protein